jgi:hypothetical protein
MEGINPMTNPESLIAGLGHAVTVSRTARPMSDGAIGTGWTYREASSVAPALAPASSDRYHQMLSWAGDCLIVVGTWLKAHSGYVSCQRA